MNPDFIFHLEIGLLVFELGAIGLWIIFPRFPVKVIVALSVSILTLLAAFRPESYNSDTNNYASYISLLTFSSQGNVYFLTKLEPFHVFLIELIRDFRAWLIIEGVVALVLVWILYTRTKTTEFFLVVCAFFSTLYTGSLRFAIALLLLSVLMTRQSRSTAYMLILSLVSACFHAVMIASGAFASRVKWFPLIFSGFFFVVAMYSFSIRSRVGADLEDVKSFGIKSFATFLVICVFVWLRRGRKDLKQTLWDVIGFSTIFFLTALFFPSLNRVIVIGAIVVLFDIEQATCAAKKPVAFDRALSFCMFAMISVPYLIQIQGLYRSGLW